MSRDMMSAFELYQPDTVEGAVELLGRFGEEGWALAGGNDSFDWFKDRVKRPKYVVDLGGIAALKGIRETPDGGVEIGALTTLTEIERSSVIQNRYKLLADAARRVASPQIRNSGTIGGNVAKTRAAGTTATASIAIAPAATPAMPTRPKARIASTASGAPTAASP